MTTVTNRPKRQYVGVAINYDDALNYDDPINGIVSANVFTNRAKH